MIRVFLSVLNMSLTASYVIAAVLLARFFLKKAPKIISYLLWAVVGFRLLFPFSFESVFSLIPFKAAPIPNDITTQPAPHIDSGIHAADNAVSHVLPAAEAAAQVNPMQVWLTAGAYLWLAGVVAMLVYSIVSIIRLKRSLTGAVLIRDNIYQADNIRTPFVLGFFRPDIFIPVGLNEEEKRYIILHEQTHIRRGDPVVKLLGYFALCLHWFNPLAWAAFLCMGADMEMSCDEHVLKEMGSETKKSYSLSLLSLAADRRMIGGSPLAFGEGGMKARIKNVLNFRKPSRVAVSVALAAAAILSTGFAMNQPDEPQGLLIRADVSGDGQKEALCLDTSRQKSGSVTLRIYNGSGKEIWSEDALTAHAGWNSLFLYEEDGKHCLLRYTPAMVQGSGTYTYSLFTINGDGTEQVVRTNRIEFNIYGPDEPDAAKMAAFAEEINTLLGKSTLLLSSEGGEYSFGPSSADPFFEKYSVLDSARAASEPAKLPETGVKVSRRPEKPEDVISIYAEAITKKDYDTYLDFYLWSPEGGENAKKYTDKDSEYNLQRKKSIDNYKSFKLVKYKEIRFSDYYAPLHPEQKGFDEKDVHYYLVAYDCEVYQPDEYVFNGRNYFAMVIGKDGETYRILDCGKPLVLILNPSAKFGDKEEKIQEFIENEFQTKGVVIDSDSTLVGVSRGPDQITPPGGETYWGTKGLTVEEYLKSIGEW